MGYDRAVHVRVDAAPAALANKSLSLSGPGPSADQETHVSSPTAPLKVLVLGVRGFPNVQGGVETHAEQLYVRLARLGCDVEVAARTPFVPADRRTFDTIRVRRIWAPVWPGFEALIHSMLGVFYAAVTRPQILHIHAVGPAIVTPLARLMGLRVVVTHHGPDYDRDKWGGVARWVLRTGERLGMRHANGRIVISRVIADLVSSKYGCDSDLIRNGVVERPLHEAADQVRRFDLEPGRYFLNVARMVPEKRHLDLIAAYAAAKPAWKLVLAGAVHSNHEYSQQVVAAAEAAGVVLTGFQTGTTLEQLYTHAGAFVLPSSHEGLPIAALEALSYGLPVLASDISANLEIGLDAGSYFPMGDRAALARGLLRFQEAPRDEATRAARRAWTVKKFDWNQIAEQTLRVYRRVVEE
jgi:glycosyltransferase involved in cell wall biosynthesis